MSRSLVEVQALKEEMTKMDYPLLKEKLAELGVSHVWKGGVKKSVIVQAALKALEEKETEEAKNPKVETVETESETEEDEEEIEDETPILPFGEIKVTEGILDLFPAIATYGFNVGDTIIHEDGKPLYKKIEEIEVKEEINVSEELKLKAGDIGFGTEGITTKKTIEEADAEIKEDNKNIKPEDITDLTDVPPSSTQSEEEYLASQNTGADNSEEDEEESEEDEIESFETVVAQDEKEYIDESKYTLEEIQENLDITNGLIPQSIPSTRIFLLHKLEALEAAKERKLSK